MADPTDAIGLGPEDLVDGRHRLALAQIRLGHPPTFVGCRSRVVEHHRSDTHGGSLHAVWPRDGCRLFGRTFVLGLGAIFSVAGGFAGCVDRLFQGGRGRPLASRCLGWCGIGCFVGLIGPTVGTATTLGCSIGQARRTVGGDGGHGLVAVGALARTFRRSGVHAGACRGERLRCVQRPALLDSAAGERPS